MPSQSIFIILRAASDTLPTSRSVNLQRRHIQCDATCPLCNCARPTTAHVLSGCPVTLSQDRYTYCHDQVLSCLVSGISDILTEDSLISIYMDPPGMRASEYLLGTVSISLMVTSNFYHPDVVIHHVTSNSVALLELMCPWILLNIWRQQGIGNNSNMNFFKFCRNLTAWVFPPFMTQLR